VIVGGALVGVGAILYGVGKARETEHFLGGFMEKPAGLVVGSVGLVTILVGGVVTIIEITPDEPSETTAGTELIPAVSLGPTGGSLTWRF
jgi:hypothetical protein